MSSPKALPVFKLFSITAWMALVAGAGPFLFVPSLCTTTLINTMPVDDLFSSLLVWISPAQLLISWIIMLFAMMLPLLVSPVSQVRARSYKRLQGINTTAFVLGYFIAWTMAGLVLISMSLYLKTLVPNSYVLYYSTLIIAIAWQLTTYKQAAMNRCHSLPSLPTFGAQPQLACIKYGGYHGWYCVCSCAPLMLTTLTVPNSPLIWMGVVAIWMWMERHEMPTKPAFGGRLPMRAVRACVFHASMFLRRPIASH